MYLCLDEHQSERSAHTTAVGCRQPLNGLPGSLRVHEGHSLVASRPAAGGAGDLLAGNAPFIHQALQGQVIVPAGAVTRSNTVLEEYYLVRVIAEAQISYSHLLPLQVAVSAALGLLSIPS